MQIAEGPGGVGNTDGSSSLKLWYTTTNGVGTAGALIETVANSAGIPALDMAAAGGLRPTLVTGVVNSFDEMSFTGGQRLQTGTNLTAANFVTNAASSFIVSRPDNTTQQTNAYSTWPLNGNRFSNHIPWANTVYFDIGNCCGAASRMQVGGAATAGNYDSWGFGANGATGKQLYRNGLLLQNRGGVSSYNPTATQRFSLGSAGFRGDMTEVIIYIVKLNDAQRIIVENYLAAKYGLASEANDLYLQDTPANGNYDFDVAGIGQIGGANQTNSRGTGIVRVSNPSNLNNNEFFIWGHDNGLLEANEQTDVPTGVAARLVRVWRVSELRTNGNPTNVGDVNVSFDLTGLGTVTPSDLRLLVDNNNNGTFADDVPIAGATDLGANIYQFAGVNTIDNAERFTLGTINITQTPLPIELLSFNVVHTDFNTVKIEWKTASETNNDFFTIERSTNGSTWNSISTTEGAGNSTLTRSYTTIDDEPIDGVAYYRLKQTDFDGQFTYSNVRQIKSFAKKVEKLKIYPNPATNSITITGSAYELESITFYNTLGQNITPFLYKRIVEDNEVRVDISSLKQGIYFIKTNMSTSKLIKNE